MKVNYWLLLLFVSVVVSCRKETTDPPPPPISEVPTVPTGSDTQVFRIKDINYVNLPSPYYHFDYNDSGYITNMTYVSGLWNFGFSYADKKLRQMQNDIIVNKDKMKYEYSDDGNVSVIRVEDSTGKLRRKYLFTYTALRQLKQLDVYVNAGSGIAQEQTMTFSYYANGNLNEMITHYYKVGSQTELTFTDKYEDYDNKPNADGVGLLNASQFRHPIILPSVKLQLNNARKVRRTGSPNDYNIIYTLVYDAAGRPTSRTGDFVYTSGSQSGQHFTIQSSFSWYN